MSSALRVANVVHVLAAKRNVDHLKLQKLTFYAYGAALAHDVSSELGEIHFAPWKHGPVNREVWDAHRGNASAILPLPASVARFLTELTQVITDVVEVYGRLGSWEIRCESHLETPWIEAWEQQQARIPEAAIAGHFREKFSPGKVQLPANLGAVAVGRIDGIPSPRFASLASMANALRG